MRIPLVVAAALLLLHAAFVVFGPRPRETRFQSGDQLNRHVIEEYVRHAQRSEVLFVGSSMTARLGTSIGESCATNLSLGGESSLTGLSVVAEAKAKPKLVFVEINVPERTINASLVGQGTRALPRLLRPLATENMPVNLLFSFLSQYKPPAAEKSADAAITSKALAVQREFYSQQIAPSLLSENMRTLAGQVRGLEASGTRVVFFELPIHPDLEHTVRARQIREVFSLTFPKHRLITSAELAGSMRIHTIDGVHLATDESVVIGHALRDAYNGLCNDSAFSRAVDALGSHAKGMAHG